MTLDLDRRSPSPRGSILLLGATGLLGAAVFARLRDQGTEVVAVSRSRGSALQRLSADRVLQLDLRTATSVEHWLPHLIGITAVVNCAGVLQDSARDSTLAVHVEAPRALYAAAERAGVRRIRGRAPTHGDWPRLGDPEAIGRGGARGLWRERIVPRVGQPACSAADGWRRSDLCRPARRRRRDRHSDVAARRSDALGSRFAGP
ncbi:NAD-dependent epimerase/dehydratase family protein [Chelatococcus reniformis]|uniref:NAD-dependent epimerase/dehydratase family protein n=1 Tax=Chelatococcus reniformis TaxID=1494448 RepID=UPI00166A467D